MSTIVDRNRMSCRNGFIHCADSENPITRAVKKYKDKNLHCHYKINKQSVMCPILWWISKSIHVIVLSLLVMMCVQHCHVFVSLSIAVQSALHKWPPIVIFALHGLLACLEDNYTSSREYCDIVNIDSSLGPLTSESQIRCIHLHGDSSCIVASGSSTTQFFTTTGILFWLNISGIHFSGFGASIVNDGLMYISGKVTLGVYNCWFDNIQGDNGGVIFASATEHLNIINSVFRSNTVFVVDW